MKYFFYTLYCSFFTCLITAQHFPETKKTPAVINRHQISFNDDYVWLQDMDSPEVSEWVEAQNLATESHLKNTKKEFDPAFRIKDYDFLSSNALPSKKGQFFYSKYRADKNFPAVLFYRKTLNDSPKELLDPYKISKNKNIVLVDYYPSKNSAYLAYMISENGGDRNEIRFTGITSDLKSNDIIKHVKFSGVSWNKNLGVFYKRNSNKNTFAKDSTYQLYYHRLGTEQDLDQLILDTSKDESTIRFFTKENILFVTEVSKDESKSTYYYCSLDDENFKLEKILENDNSGFDFLTYSNGRIYFSSTNYGWGEIRSFDIKNRQDETVIVPQIYMNLLVSFDYSDDYIFCKYKALGKNYIIVYDKTGKFVRRFDAPQGMDFSIRFYQPETKELFVSFYSYVISFQNFRLNVETGEVNNYYNNYIKPKVTLFPLDHFEIKTISYKSRDDNDIPITIVFKKGLKLDGTNPTLLKAYGGFGTITGQTYDTGLLYFLEKGGVYAFAEIRGGGEKGLSWHKEGKGAKKTNSINDFIDAAEFLISEKYTSPNRLAITGGSHGGFIVGAAMIQRPELFKVAIPVAGRFDVLTLEEYTSGKFHLDEYGNPNIKEDYQRMLAYSPYQNIKEDVNYPTTLIITSENDDRVPPLQSYKFAARLQNRAAQKNPVYLKTLSDAGHSGKVSTYTGRIGEKADFYSFLLYNLMQ